MLDGHDLTEIIRLTQDGDSFGPAWSPNGDQIAYLHRDGQAIDLRIMSIDVSRGLTLVEDRTGP